MNREKLIAGNLILGAAGRGKTTELANMTKNLLDLNPDWHLLAVGGFDYSEKLNAEIKYDVRHEVFKYSQTNSRVVQNAFLNSLAEICEQQNYNGLIVVDEPAIFFSDDELRKEFVKLILDSNANTKSANRLYLLITAQSMNWFEERFGIELAVNLNSYTLLRTRRTGSFFEQFGIDTATIDYGFKYLLERNDQDKAFGRITAGDIKFPATITDGAFRFNSKFLHFSLLILPLLVTSYLYYYYAPALEWISIGNGEHNLTQKIFDLKFTLRNLLAGFFYFISFILFVNSIGKTALLYNYSAEKRIAYFNKEMPLTIFLTSMSLVVLVFINTVISTVIEIPPYYPIGIK